MKNNNHEINEIIRQIKEYQDLQEQIKAELEVLKAEAIDYLNDEGIDEVLTDAGKITFRQIISRRFDSTAFKKVMPELYKAYTKQTASRRFTISV